MLSGIGKWVSDLLRGYIWQNDMERKFHSLSLYVTTACNFHCSFCCAGTAMKATITPREVIELGKHLGHVKELIITGGEPTLHKHFPALMEEIIKFDYDKLILATNGFRVMKYWKLMKHFDEVRISHYTKDSGPEITDNTDTIEEILLAQGGPKRVVVQPITLTDNDPDKKGVCGRANNGIASYFNGKIYGCCVAAGMSEGMGVPFDSDWRQKAKYDTLPCYACVFATER